MKVAKSGKVKIGLVGCGAIAKMNALAIKHAPNASLSYVMDVRKDISAAFGATYKIPWTSRIEVLLDSPEVDCVFICTPHFQHAPLAEASARAGKHVVVEKPMGSSLAQTERIVHACHEAGVVLSTCYCMRFSERIRLLKNFIKEDGLGQIVGIQIEMLRDRSSSFFGRDIWQEGNADWHAVRKKSGGGMFIDNFSHYLDYFSYVSGQEPSWVQCQAQTRIIPADVEDTLWATIGYKDGVLGTIISSSVMPGARRQQDSTVVNSLQRIWGDEGQALILPRFGLFSYRRALKFEPNCWHFPRPDKKYNGGGAGIYERTLYINDVANAIQTETKPSISGEDGLRVMKVVDAAYRSAQQGGDRIQIE